MTMLAAMLDPIVLWSSLSASCSALSRVHWSEYLVEVRSGSTLYQHILPAAPHLSSLTKKPALQGVAVIITQRTWSAGNNRDKGTASLLGWLFPQSDTGNNTTRNNTFRSKGQSSVGIHRRTAGTCSIHMHSCLRGTNVLSSQSLANTE